MTIKECKEWLSRARKTDEEINALIAEQERALTNATSTVAQSGSEKVQTSNVNTSENKFISYAAYSELIDKRIDSYKQVCRLHGKALNLIKDVIECPIAPVI